MNEQNVNTPEAGGVPASDVLKRQGPGWDPEVTLRAQEEVDLVRDGADGVLAVDPLGGAHHGEQLVGSRRLLGEQGADARAVSRGLPDGVVLREAAQHVGDLVDLGVAGGFVGGLESGLQFIEHVHSPGEGWFETLWSGGGAPPMVPRL